LRQVRHSAARTIRGTALSTDRHASLLFGGSLAVASMAKKRSKSGTGGPDLAKPVASMTRPAPSLGPTCPMRARFGHESGEFACR
jgi:hypothetical protein